MSLALLKKLLASLSLFVCASVVAAPLVVDVTGIESVGLRGNPNNTVLNFQVGANARITTLDFAFTITAYGPSWLSEMALMFGGSQGSGLVLAPDESFALPGTMQFSGGFDLVDAGQAFAVGDDGILRLEFFEIFNDFSGADGIWNTGTLTFGVVPATQEVPEPASALLLGVGLALMGYAVRRRRARRAPGA